MFRREEFCQQGVGSIVQVNCRSEHSSSLKYIARSDKLPQMMSLEEAFVGDEDYKSENKETLGLRS